MHGKKIVLVLLAASLSLAAAEFSGASALEYTKAAVAFGPRPPGSDANRKLQNYIRGKLKSFGYEIVEDSFMASTPTGPVQMANVIGHLPGTSIKSMIFSGHFDTKPMPGIDFVGANDGGSSTGLLLELARVLASRKHKQDIYLVWFDGEEAFVQYTGSDGFYGSRHLAQRWEQEGVLKKILAMINVDMIGDRDLGILKEQYSKVSLNDLIWQTAAELGYGKYFLDDGGAVLDDHIQFVEKFVAAANLIDFNYGPNNSYWHTPKDTMDKVSAHSLEVVGKVLVGVLTHLEAPATAAPRSATPSR